MGSDSLTQEEQDLRAELRNWCRRKLANGARPIPILAALTIVAEDMKDPDASGIRTS
jgi:hypothetical protein